MAVAARHCRQPPTKRAGRGGHGVPGSLSSGCRRSRPTAAADLCVVASCSRALLVACFPHALGASWHGQERHRAPALMPACAGRA
eukprot:15469584-Alexandrium_andersonii.AAC.1